jgi:hypothetical protein
MEKFNMTESESDKMENSAGGKSKMGILGFPGLAISALVIGAGICWFGVVTVNQFCDTSRKIDMFSPKSVTQIEKGSTDTQIDKYFQAAQYERVIQALNPRIEAFKKFGKADDPFLANSELRVGKCYLMMGKYAEAKASYEDAIAIYTKLGNYKGSPLGDAQKDYDIVVKHLQNKEAK